MSMDILCWWFMTWKLRLTTLTFNIHEDRLITQIGPSWNYHYLIITTPGSFDKAQGSSDIEHSAQHFCTWQQLIGRGWHVMMRWASRVIFYVSGSSLIPNNRGPLFACLLKCTLLDYCLWCRTCPIQITIRGNVHIHYRTPVMYRLVRNLEVVGTNVAILIQNWKLLSTTIAA